MFADERQDLIYELVNEKGSVTVSELTQKFGVSIETVRRDLLTMEKNKMLYRVHGGAVKIGEMRRYDELSVRLTENNPLKEELCRNAMAFIEEGDTIAVDSGSTAVVFAETLKAHFSSITVVTHSLDVFKILSDYKDFNVVLCGGYFKRKENSFGGPLTVAMYEKVYVQKAFIFPSALSLHFGIRERKSDVIDIQQQMIKSADKVFILADSSKFECKDFYKTDDMRQSFIYITDSGLPLGLKDMYCENSINIITESKQINKGRA